jgi:hypothetical protein
MPRDRLRGWELRNVVANYPFERSHRFAGSSRILATETVAFELRLSRRLGCLVCRRRTTHQEAHIPFNDLNAERHEGC